MMLPSGKDTTNSKRYAAEWNKVLKPICNKFDVKVVGFDPQVMFADIKTGATVQIPLWFAKRLAIRPIKTKSKRIEKMERDDSGCPVYWR